VSRNWWLRVGGTIVVTGLATAYIVAKVDLGRTIEILGSADLGWLALSTVLVLVSVVPMAWRWQLLLASRGVREQLAWLTRAYFVSYAVGQVLPTSVGGDVSRIYETNRRHPGQITPITGSVLLERALGGAVTLALAGAGLLLAIGRYDIGAYLWIELLFVIGTILVGIFFFSRSVRRRLRFAVPLARRFRLETAGRAVYDGIHGYREHPWTMIVVCLATVLLQASRVVSIWASARAVGIELSLLPYFVLGPLLFLVMLIPFTINGLAVREAFFVSFLGRLGVDADAAFACGFLFFIMTLLLAAPGAVIVVWELARGVRRQAAVPDA
jgi:uncharacterized protein (TIRG00374 family)